MRILKRYKGVNFDQYKTPTKEHERLLKLIQAPITNNIVISGRVGTGKTFLMYCLINRDCPIKTLDYGSKPIEIYENDKYEFTTIKAIIDDIRAGWKSKAVDISKYLTTPILIVDEIGLQYGTDSERIELYEIFNERWNQELPTIAISNLNKKAPAGKNSIETILGQRICDRLFSGADYFELNCESMR